MCNKLIKIAEALDKYQKEITYYQTRIRNILENINKKTKETKTSAKPNQ